MNQFSFPGAFLLLLGYFSLSCNSQKYGPNCMSISYYRKDECHFYNSFMGNNKLPSCTLILKKVEKQNEKTQPNLELRGKKLEATNIYTEEQIGTGLRGELDTVSRVLKISGNGKMKDWLGGGSILPPWCNEREIIAVLIIGDGITKIGSCSFIYFGSLKTVTIPPNVRTIARSGFEQCQNLVSVTITSNLTLIDERVFFYCPSLKTITIPSSVSKIGREAFSYCRSLVSVIIPSNITLFGAGAFEYCDLLTFVKYCGSTKPAYDIENPPFLASPINSSSIQVTSNYQFSSFCGVGVVKSLEEKCQFSQTIKFSSCINTKICEVCQKYYILEIFLFNSRI